MELSAGTILIRKCAKQPGAEPFGVASDNVMCAAFS